MIIEKTQIHINTNIFDKNESQSKILYINTPVSMVLLYMLKVGFLIFFVFITYI